MHIPRQEHPNPQFARETWTNLNGEWEFEIDYGKSGIDRKFYERDSLEGKITVPFCPESQLSGVGCKDFMEAVWYRRTFTLTPAQLQGRILLHFGAVDYETVVYLNKQEVGRHQGGYTSFTFDITPWAVQGKNVLTVCAIDETRNPRQPRGKQSELYYSHLCDYTRTTGIWQTVWLEYVPEAYIRQVRYYPDVENQKLTVMAQVQGQGRLTVETSFQGTPTGSASALVSDGAVSLEIPLSQAHLWEPGQGRLYDLTLTFGQDRVQSYFGLRSVRLDGMKFLINGKSVFQRLVLDQGFYPDGIYTAPDDQALLRDIQLSMAVGFNGARLHQKVFEPRFLYHCDRLGYLVWGEYGNWGLDHTDIRHTASFLGEWRESVDRDFNHPAIIGWCPFNETWDLDGRKQADALLETVYRETKFWDPTRPCIDTSGNYHVATDIFDIHNYEQDIERFAAAFAELDKPEPQQSGWDQFAARQRYQGQPIFVSEYGGIGWESEGGGRGWDTEKTEENWGYGNGPKTKEEFLTRLKGLTDALLDCGKCFGFCYTQLYDVEQEVNGLYTYHRKEKFDTETLRQIIGRPGAKIEE